LYLPVIRELVELDELWPSDEVEDDPDDSLSVGLENELECDDEDEEEPELLMLDWDD